MMIGRNTENTGDFGAEPGAGPGADTYRLLVEATRELLCLHDVSGQFTFVSPSIFPLLGYTPEELIGTSPFDFVHDADREDLAEALRAAVEEDVVPLLTSRFRGADGEYRWIEVQTRALRGDSDRVTHLVTSSRDVSIRRQLLARISNREATLRSVVSSFDDLVFVFDAAGRFREYYQPTKRQDLYAPPEAFLGRTPTEALPREVAEPLSSALERAWEEQAVQEFDYELTVNEILRHFHAKLTPMLGPDPSVQGVVGVVRDVTGRRSEEQARMELLEARARAERLEALAVLARGTAHEFNNIMTAVQGNLGLVQDDLPGDHPAREGVSAAMEAADRAAGVTRQLLTYAGEGHGPALPLELGELVRGLEAELRPLLPSTVRLEVRCDARIPSVEGNPTLLSSALHHLIRNAIEALPDQSGSVEIEVFLREYGREQLRRSRVQPPPSPGSFVGIEVEDSGEGIDPEALDRIFDPFFSTRFLGRGLGLAEVSGIVRAHRGGLLASSEPGAGSSFVLLLPTS